MQELEKILEEINKRIDRSMLYSYQHAEGLREAKDIIRKHMNDSERTDTFEFDFSGVKSFDCQCGVNTVRRRLETKA